MNMPLCTVRQLLELIDQDTQVEAKFKAQLLEWSTKHICGMFISMSEDQKHADKLKKHVENLHLKLAFEDDDDDPIHVEMEKIPFIANPIEVESTEELMDDPVPVKAGTFDENAPAWDSNTNIDINNLPSYDALSQIFGPQ